MKRVITLCALFLSFATNADVITVYANRDVTLIEHPHGEWANGSGSALFVGRTGQSSNAIRRAMLYFDVAGALPEGAQIVTASLTLYLTASNSQPAKISVHRVLQEWREGPSKSSGGSGAAAQNGDATWLHTNYDVAYWNREGGHFVTQASTSLEVTGSATYVWPVTSKLLADVRAWQYAPHINFGWMLVGDEGMPQSAKRFSSRETAQEMNPPKLSIEYRMPGKKL